MHAVIHWMKEFLILYLLLTILMQLAAAEEYKKYLRFLSGIILMLVLVSPLLRLLTGDGGLEMMQSYDRFFGQLDAVSQDGDQLQFLQDGHNLAAYEDAVSADILSQARQKNIPVTGVSVSLSETYQIKTVTVWLDVLHTQEQPSAKEELLAFLKQTYQLEDAQIFTYDANPG